MPKKRQGHLGKWSKPQSTAPASLATSSSASASTSTSTSRANDHHHGPENAGSVNARLAEARLAELRHHGRANLAEQQALEKLQWAVAPSMPPSLSAILQLPHPPVRARGRRRGVAGPPAPPSWLSGRRSQPALARLGPDGDVGMGIDMGVSIKPLPGLYLPAKGSLVDIALRRFAVDWDSHRRYYRYDLYYDMPDHLKTALVSYLASRPRDGVSVSDLQALFLPPVGVEVGVEVGDGHGHDDDAETSPEPWPSVPQAVTHLDLSGSLSKALKLIPLAQLLFPAARARARVPAAEPQESWEDAATDLDLDLDSTRALDVGAPRPLLPRLTHLNLSLALNAATGQQGPFPFPFPFPPAASWRHLLSLSTHLHSLTHLSLASWPAPTLTPNAAAMAARVVAPSPSAGGAPGAPGEARAVQYGGTGLYSHALDDDYDEASWVASRLSRNTYGLEYLDLTGCGAWAPAVLTRGAAHGHVDWAGCWAKVATVVLRPACPPRDAQDEERRCREVKAARALERHVRAQRQGQGRLFTVVV